MTDYELWSWADPLWYSTREDWLGHSGRWNFHGYRRLTLAEVMAHERFGYVVRKVIGDRSSTIPLFPLLGRTGSYPEDGLD